MGLLETIRRQFPIAFPLVVELPEEEFLWPEVKARSVSIPTIEPPGPSRDFTFTQPETHDTPVLDPHEVDLLDLDCLLPTFEISNLFDPLERSTIYGTIYIKQEEKVVQRGEVVTKTKLVPQAVRLAAMQKQPRGLNIFDMLLAVLMPPAATEFREELLFPQELYPFQRAGVKWLFENESALLADDMGLGKTVQAITAFRALIRRSLALQALVVCPKSVLTNWMRELERWAPELVAIRVHGNQPARDIAWRAFIGKCHVLVTTYETARQDRESIKGRVFDLIVADEAQKIKNPDTDISRAIRGLNARRRWALTGTPLENKEQDTAAIFAFVKPGLFQMSEIPLLSPRTVRERIRPYMLRRRKEDALPELPKKVVDTKLLELTEPQRFTYDQAELEGTDRLRTARDVTVQHVLALIQKLKQICNFDPQTSESTKMDFLLEEYLEQACSEDQKTLIFSQYVQTLKEIERRIDEYKPLVYTGQLSTAQRERIEKDFASKDEHKVLLLSLRAGGVGVNLTRANYVLHFDRWWNPAVEWQAEDRTHRIGQLRTVFVTRLICQETIEERIEQLLKRKKILFQEVVDELADVSLERVLSEEDLFGLFGLAPPRRSREVSREAPPEIVPRPGAGQQQAVVIKPEEPFSNVIKLRRILRECEEYIWWADPYFRGRGLEELWEVIMEVIDPAMVREVRILSGPANVDEKAKSDFARFEEEVKRKGITAQWRVLTGFSHDRFIVSKNACFNVPSIDTVLRGMYSEINETPNRPPFESWWEKGAPIKDWTPGSIAPRGGIR